MKNIDKQIVAHVKLVNYQMYRHKIKAQNVESIAPHLCITCLTLSRYSFDDIYRARNIIDYVDDNDSITATIVSRHKMKTSINKDNEEKISPSVLPR